MLPNINLIRRSFLNQTANLAKAYFIRRPITHTFLFRNLTTINLNQVPLNNSNLVSFNLLRSKKLLLTAVHNPLYVAGGVNCRSISTGFALYRGTPNAKGGYPSDYIKRKQRAKRRRLKKILKRTRIQRLQKKTRKKYLKKIRDEKEADKFKRKITQFHVQVTHYLAYLERRRSKMTPPTEEEAAKAALQKEVEVAAILPEGEQDRFAPSRLTAYDFPWIYPKKKPKRRSVNRKRRFRLKKVKAIKKHQLSIQQQKEKQERQELEEEQQRLESELA